MVEERGVLIESRISGKIAFSCGNLQHGPMILITGFIKTTSLVRYMNELLFDG